MVGREQRVEDRIDMVLMGSVAAGLGLQVYAIAEQSESESITLTL